MNITKKYKKQVIIGIVIAAAFLLTQGLAFAENPFAPIEKKTQTFVDWLLSWGVSIIVLVAWVSYGWKCYRDKRIDPLETSVYIIGGIAMFSIRTIVNFLRG